MEFGAYMVSLEKPPGDVRNLVLTMGVPARTGDNTARSIVSEAILGWNILVECLFVGVGLRIS